MSWYVCSALLGERLTVRVIAYAVDDSQSSTADWVYMSGFMALLHKQLKKYIVNVQEKPNTSTVVEQWDFLNIKSISVTVLTCEILLSALTNYLP